MGTTEVVADPAGVARSIRATYKEADGKIIAITEAGVVVLENGDTYRLNRSARVTRDASSAKPRCSSRRAVERIAAVGSAMP